MTNNNGTATDSSSIRIVGSDIKSYELFLSSSTANTSMTGSTGNSEAITSTTSSLMLNNLNDNTWGYCAALFSSCSSLNYYQPIQPNTNATVIESRSDLSSMNYAIDDTINLTFAAKINNNLLADTYKNTQLISVTAEDRTAFGITYMQEMTKTVCDSESTPSASETNVPTKQLIDRRDGKTYWVAKLADGNCWMTQNLDLDLSTTTTLTPEDSDVRRSWTPSKSTTTTLRTGNSSNTAVQSFDLGEYVINSPNTGTDLCASFVANISSCSGIASMTNVSSDNGYTADYVATGTGTAVQAVDTANKKYDAHYLLGNYYSPNAATAGTSPISNIDARSSICPKGWHLPTSGNTTSGSFGYLLAAYGLPSTNTNSATAAQASQVRIAPLYFLQASRVDPIATNGLSGIGARANYMTKTTYDSTYVYSFQTTGNTTILPTRIQYRYVAGSIRCVANDTYEDFDEIGLEYMQDMTTNICSSIRTPAVSETTTVPTKQLIDRRDGKKYWVAKLADGNCWMTQNLALDLSTDVTLTPDDSDVSANWTPNSNTRNTARTNNTSATAIQSWSWGDWVVNMPNAGTNLCSSVVSSVSLCSGVASMTNVSSDNGYTDDYVATGSGASVQAVDTSSKKYDAHYLLGNYYVWNAATAGTGGTITGANATSSICPKGWRLASANSTTDATFKTLVGTYSIKSTVDSINAFGSAPLYFHRAGVVSADQGLWRIGNMGYYMSSKAAATNYISNLRFQNNGITPVVNGYRYEGMSIRCLAR